MYLVQISFKTKSGEVRKGQIINMPEDKAQPLLEAGKVTELGVCHICHEYAWWLSVYGVLVCGVCHPPFAPDLVKRWIGNQDVLSHLKGSKAGMVFSWQEIQERKAAGKREGAG